MVIGPTTGVAHFHPRVGNFMLGLASDTEKGMESFHDLKKARVCSFQRG